MAIDLAPILGRVERWGIIIGISLVLLLLLEFTWDKAFRFSL